MQCNSTDIVGQKKSPASNAGLFLEAILRQSYYVTVAENSFSAQVKNVLNVCLPPINPVLKTPCFFIQQYAENHTANKVVVTRRKRPLWG
jgi:hypothetical protein